MDVDTLERAVESGVVALGKLSTYADATTPASVRAMDIFQQAPAPHLVLPLNRKTTESALQLLPLTHLEPTQAFIPVRGLAAYLARSRRDPPDVAHVVMRDGRERWVVQEGHTRLGAAILRGDAARDVRVWEFVEDAQGRVQPVPRGLHKRGLTYRDKLLQMSGDFGALDLDKDEHGYGSYPKSERVNAIPDIVRGAWKRVTPDQAGKVRWYHGTATKHVSQILEDGLKPGEDDTVVWMTSNLDDAMRFATMRALRESGDARLAGTILEVRVPADASVRLEARQHADEKWTGGVEAPRLIAHGAIPASWVRVHSELAPGPGRAVIEEWRRRMTLPQEHPDQSKKLRSDPKLQVFYVAVVEPVDEFALSYREKLQFANPTGVNQWGGPGEWKNEKEPARQIREQDVEGSGFFLEKYQQSAVKSGESVLVVLPVARAYGIEYKDGGLVSPTTVVEMVAAWSNGYSVPALEASVDEKGNFHISDGQHRLAAAKQAGRTEVVALVPRSDKSKVNGLTKGLSYREKLSVIALGDRSKYPDGLYPGEREGGRAAEKVDRLPSRGVHAGFGPVVATPFETRSGEVVNDAIEGTRNSTPTIEEVKISDLLATQDHVFTDKVKEYLAEPEKVADLPKVIEAPFGDGFLINDGHHRAVAAWARGEKTIKTRVYRFSAHALSYREKLVAVMLGDRSKYPDGLYPGEQKLLHGTSLASLKKILETGLSADQQANYGGFTKAGHVYATTDFDVAAKYASHATGVATSEAYDPTLTPAQRAEKSAANEARRWDDARPVIIEVRVPAGELASFVKDEHKDAGKGSVQRQGSIPKEWIVGVHVSSKGPAVRTYAYTERGKKHYEMRPTLKWKRSDVADLQLRDDGSTTMYVPWLLAGQEAPVAETSLSYREKLVAFSNPIGVNQWGGPDDWGKDEDWTRGGVAVDPADMFAVLPSDAVEYYAKGLATPDEVPLLDFLRSGGDPSSIDRGDSVLAGTVEQLDALAAAHPLKQDVELHRLTYGDFGKTLQVGTMFTEKAFTATSKSLVASEETHKTKLDELGGDVSSDTPVTRAIIEAPAGTGHIDINGVIGRDHFNEHQKEVLLERGLTFEVTARRGNTVTMRVVPTKQPKKLSYREKLAVALANPTGINQYGGPESWGKGVVEKVAIAAQHQRYGAASMKTASATTAYAAVDDVTKALRRQGFDAPTENKEDDLLAYFFTHPNGSQADIFVNKPVGFADKTYVVTVKHYTPAALEKYVNTPAEDVDLSDRFDLPDVTDVSFPTMIGAIPAKPPKKRKGYKYKGVQLSRKPMKFEAQVLSLTEIPPRLDGAVLSLVEQDTTAHLRASMYDIAFFGAQQVLLELHRQGAPEAILGLHVELDVEPLWEAVTRDRHLELASVRSQIVHKLSQRKLTGARLAEWSDELLERRTPAMVKRFANRAVNEAFALGRMTAINLFRRPHDFDLAKKYRDADGKFISIFEAVQGGDVLVDAVVQTAVMDTFTCDPCAEVDGEVMDFGDKRQLELHPPYVKCFGGDRCRCIQIAILDNGAEVNVDEIDEDTIG